MILHNRSRQIEQPESQSDQPTPAITDFFVLELGRGPSQSLFAETDAWFDWPAMDIGLPDELGINIQIVRACLVGACQANQSGLGGLSFSKWMLARITSKGTSASFLPCRSFQRSSFTCPNLGCSNVMVSSGTPQVSGSLKAKRSPCTLGRPRFLFFGCSGAQYKTRSRRRRTTIPQC